MKAEEQIKSLISDWRKQASEKMDVFLELNPTSSRGGSALAESAQLQRCIIELERIFKP